MSRRSLALGTAALLLAPAAARAQHGWVNVPGQGWRYQVTVSATDARFRCATRIVGATCTPSGNSLLLAYGQEQFTLAWQPGPAATVLIDPNAQDPTTNFVALGSWKWTATPGFVFPKLEKGVVSPLFRMWIGGTAPVPPAVVCNQTCWSNNYWAWHVPGNDRAVAITSPGTGIGYIYPRAAAHPVTGYDKFLVFLQYSTPQRVVIDGSMTEGEVEVSMQAVLSPEPSTLALLGGGVAMLLRFRGRRRRRE
jgi:hypothetical protein